MHIKNKIIRKILLYNIYIIFLYTNRAQTLNLPKKESSGRNEKPERLPSLCERFEKNLHEFALRKI